MIYGSVCSGIEAASVAWHPLGWRAAFLSEIEPFPRAVLQHHYPVTPLHGDFTTIKADQYEPIELLVGGTPCQSFSVAGLRAGMADPRGNLALGFLGLADRLRPRWILWENVPGVLSSNAGRDFGAFLGGLAELGYGFAYRVLDAQYVRVDGFGRAVPQRRRRVFVVGCLGDWRRAAAVLFERHSLSGHPAPRREAGQVAPTVPCRSSGGGGLGTDFDCDGGLVHCPPVSPAMKALDSKGPSSDGDGDGLPLIAHSLRADGFDASEDGTGRGTPLVSVVAPTLASNGDAYSGFRDEHGLIPETHHGSQSKSTHAFAVRRLTPRECERLMGFPDDYTLVPYHGKPAKDGPRYKALGNSMAVNCMRWLGTRIQMVEDAMAPHAEADAA